MHHPNAIYSLKKIHKKGNMFARRWLSVIDKLATMLITCNTHTSASARVRKQCAHTSLDARLIHEYFAGAGIDHTSSK